MRTVVHWLFPGSLNEIEGTGFPNAADPDLFDRYTVSIDFFCPLVYLCVTPSIRSPNSKEVRISEECISALGDPFKAVLSRSQLDF
jgi:hypothetical protein